MFLSVECSLKYAHKWQCKSSNQVFEIILSLNIDFGF